jgi:hypothetical protein
LMKVLKPLGDAFKAFFDGIKLIWDFLGDLIKNKTFDVIAAGLAVVTAAWWAWNAAMNMSPIGQVALALGAIVTAIGYISEHKTEIDAFFDKMQNPKGVKKETAKTYGQTSSYATGNLGDSMGTPYDDPLSYGFKPPAPAPASGPITQKFDFHIYGVQGPQQAFEEAGGRFMLDMKKIQAMKSSKR